MERIFTKCIESGKSEFIALSDRRKPYTQKKRRRAMMDRKRQQQFYYNEHTKPLQPINTRETMRMKPTERQNWRAGTSLGQVTFRSYQVKIASLSTGEIDGN